MTKFNKILLVDDATVVEEMIQENLELIGLEPNIDFIYPQKNDAKYVTSILPKKEDLNKYDLALIDLELTNVPDISMGYSPGDLLGGSVILPHLRKEAPWLPVIAISQLFNREDKYFIGIGGSFGFDGHCEKHVFSTDRFNQNYWTGICHRAHTRRLESATGHYDFDHDHELEIVIGDTLEAALNAKLKSWRLLLGYMFYFAERISIKNISGGFSGAFTLEINATTTYKNKNTSNRWFIKISDNAYKLHMEAQSHRNLFYNNGLEYARSLPLMYSHVIKVNEAAAIGYQFAANTTVASEAMTSSNDFRSNIPRIIRLFNDLYTPENYSMEDEILFKLLSQWFSASSLRKAQQIRKLSKKDIISSLTQKKQNQKTEELKKYTKTLIHGDMHLGNILFGDRDIFIDFARSDYGPLVADVAKFIFHTCITIPELRSQSLTYETIISDTDNPFYKFINNIPFKNDDEELFNLFLYLHFAQAIDYKDVDQSTKDWITKSILTT